jgi:hypothetical protein
MDPNDASCYKIKNAEEASKMSLSITNTIFQGEVKNFQTNKFKWNQLLMTANVRENIYRFISKKMGKRPLLKK